MKVETHNHPTAISPFPGAATGSGGEIRDEGATGRGAKPKAGLTGFTVSHLRIPGLRAAVGGAATGKPERIASRARRSCSKARSAAPRSTTSSAGPNLAGYFRTFEQTVGGRGARLSQADHDRRRRRQHRARAHAHKAPLAPGALLIQLGGPAC